MINKSLFSSEKMDWETPKWLFDELNEHFHFTLDPCCTHENAKCLKHYTEYENGLNQLWKNEIVFCNPPYGREITNWIKKAYDESKNGKTTVVLLVPSRTDTKWFHDYIYNQQQIYFLKGRLKFGNSKNSAPFPSMIVVMRSDNND